MRLHKIKNLEYASFKDFKWDKNIPDFHDVNIILGWNGSGKTTIANVLRSLEKNNQIVNGSFEVATDIGNYKNTDSLDDFKNRIRVFNEEYVDAILRGSETMPYVFHAGEEAVDYSKEEEDLGRKKKQLQEISLDDNHTAIAQTTSKLISNIPGIQTCKKELPLGTSGVYKSYTAPDFKKRIEDIVQKSSSSQTKDLQNYKQSEKETSNIKAQLADYSKTMDMHQSIAEVIKWIRGNIAKMNEVITSTPEQSISERISTMSKDRQDWIETGVGLHFTEEGTSSSHATDCLFCGSTIINKQELLKHFSNKVVEASKSIETFLSEIIRYQQRLSETKKQATKEQLDTTTKLSNFLSKCKIALESKDKSLSVKGELIPGLDPNIKPEITDTNVARNQLAHILERHYVAEVFRDYYKKEQDYHNRLARRKALEGSIDDLSDSIQVLKSKAQSTHKAAENLNRAFKTTFPYREISIKDNPDNTGYVLERNGEHCDFRTLSEGERNFVALAYFLASINDDMNSLEDDGLVVIDDPVSSLDQTSIFQIFSLIVREISGKPKRQYIIMTHSLDFFGHIHENYRKKINKPNSKYRLYNVIIQQTGSAITPINALLKDYNSDYNYVFSVLYAHQGKCDIKDAYLMVNLLRRWLETFLKFKFSHKGDTRSLLKVAYQEAKMELDSDAMYRFITYGSHGFSDPTTMDESIFTDAHKKIQEAFQLVQFLDPLHYKKLEKLVEDSSN